MSPSFKNYHTF